MSGARWIGDASSAPMSFVDVSAGQGVAIQVAGQPTPRERLRLSVALEMARAASRLATCPRKAVGCVIVDDTWTTIATGYNGAPRGLKHCGCTMVTIGERPSCVRAVHAEANAIYSAARAGRSVVGAIAISTCRPCERCAVALYQAGVVACWYDEPYEGREEIVDELRAAGWTCERIGA